MQVILKISPNWEMDKEPEQTGLVTIGINKLEIHGEAQLERAGIGLPLAKTHDSNRGRGSTGLHTADCITYTT